MTDDAPSQHNNSIEPALPLNHFYYQLAQNGHHTHKTKWNEIVMQIFGRYGSVPYADMNTGYCPVLKQTIYRQHVMTMREYCDPIKLANPFKWLEFLIVAPLELVVFSFKRIITLCFLQILKKPTAKNFIPLILCVLLNFINTLFDLMVNLITGSIRRFLAPARYIIRPAIDMAMNYPKYFIAAMLTTAALVLTFSYLVFTGNLQADLVSASFLSWSLEAKLAVMAAASVWLGSMLTKGFDCLREWKNAKANESGQVIFFERTGYDFLIKKMDKEPELDALKLEILQQNIPLLIKDTSDDKIYVYGKSCKDEPFLNQFGWSTFLDYFFDDLGLNEVKSVPSTNQIEEKIKEKCGIKDDGEVLKKLIKAELSSTFENAYDIFNKKGHVQKRPGYSKEPCRALHHVDVKHADIKPIITKKQNEALSEEKAIEETPIEKAYNRKLRFAYFFGAEALVCPIKPSAPNQRLTGPQLN